MRSIGPALFLALVFVASVAGADPAPRDATGDSSTAMVPWRTVWVGPFGGSSFLTGRFSVMSSQLTLRPPAVLGAQPLLAVGYSNLIFAPSGFAEIGASYTDGPLRLGSNLHLAERLGQSGGPPFVTSTSYARFVMPHWDVGIDHIAQLALWGSSLRRDVQFLNVSAGAKPTPEAPSIRAGTTIPLRPVAAPSTRFSMFGTF